MTVYAYSTLSIKQYLENSRIDEEGYPTFQFSTSCFIKEIGNVFLFVFPYSYRNTRERLGELVQLEIALETLALLVFSKLALVILQLYGNTENVSYFLNISFITYPWKTTDWQPKACIINYLWSKSVLFLHLFYIYRE